MMLLRVGKDFSILSHRFLSIGEGSFRLPRSKRPPWSGSISDAIIPAWEMENIPQARGLLWQDLPVRYPLVIPVSLGEERTLMGLGDHEIYSQACRDEIPLGVPGPPLVPSAGGGETQAQWEGRALLLAVCCY